MAFLYGEGEPEILMGQAEGLKVERNPEYSCMLNKALYGPEQVPK